MKKIFPEAPITAYRRDENIQDILVHKKHSIMFRQNDEKEKCEGKCSICKVIREINTIKIENDTYKFNEKINCKTTNIVYGVICLKCKELKYVGETGTTVYERMQNHLSTIRRNHETTIAIHFNGKDHDIKDFSIICIEQIKNNNQHLRKIRESFWIKKLRTMQPRGLNMNMGVGDSFRV